MAKKQLGADVRLSTRMFITMMLLAALYGGFVWLLWSVGANFFVIVFFAAIMLGVQYFYSDKLVLMSMRARIVTPAEEPKLHAMVERLAAVADLPTPQVAVVDTEMPNAFATGRNPSHSVVAVTRGLLNRLEPAEVEAVLAHELTHVKNWDVAVITLASFFATVASLIMQNMRYSMMFGGYNRRRNNDRSSGGVAVIWLASMLVWVISYFLIRALSRYREFSADRGAAIITGAPGQLMSALMKISGLMSRIPTKDLRQAEALNAFYIIPALRGENVMELFSTHPSLERRLANLKRIEAEMSGR
jgi:heat shock protein HtpX